MLDEWETRPLLAKLIAAGKRVYAPRTLVKAHRLLPVRLFDVEALRTGACGIPEPRADESCGPEELEFIIVPGRAFDAEGNRMGRGAAYYDGFLPKATRAVFCGACFDCQIMDSVPHDETDVPVHLVVTESRTLRVDA